MMKLQSKPEEVNSQYTAERFNIFERFFVVDFFQYFIQHYLIMRPSDLDVSIDAGFETSRTVTTSALACQTL